MLSRSWLFVPGNSLKRIQKAEVLDPDIIIYDLEDAVSIHEKEEARKTVCQSLQATDKNIYVRVNAIDTPFFLDDINALLEHHTHALKGILLPKASESNQIIIAEYLLDTLEKKYVIEEKLEIVPLIETASGVHNCYEIAKSSKRVTRLSFGAVDYSLDANVIPSDRGLELMYVRSKIVNISRAAGIEMPIDTVFVDFKNDQGMQNETDLAKRLGFGGKLVIHPNQISIVNKSFAPTEEEIQESEEIMKIVETTGQALFQLNGKMVDEPVIKRAKKISETAKLLLRN